ncbi:MAG: DUF4403 family protein [Saprospiraceae bacterium]|nr:DUF4403 family protein [Saprospiraceae bacterium]
MVKLSSQKKPSDLINNLNFEIQPSYDNISELQIQSRVPMQYIEQLCREGVENQSYGSGLTKITVQKIKLNGYKETLQVRLHTLGAYDGELELSFIPRFNSSKKLIQLEEFRIASISGKKLDKTIFNLVQGIIQNKLKSTMEDFFNATIQDYVKSYDITRRKRNHANIYHQWKIARLQYFKFCNLRFQDVF